MKVASVFLQKKVTMLRLRQKKYGHLDADMRTFRNEGFFPSLYLLAARAILDCILDVEYIDAFPRLPDMGLVMAMPQFLPLPKSVIDFLRFGNVGKFIYLFACQRSNLVSCFCLGTEIVCFLFLLKEERDKI